MSNGYNAVSVSDRCWWERPHRVYPKGTWTEDYVPLGKHLLEFTLTFANSRLHVEDSLDE